ncbi:MAG: hypothetical protein B7O98_03235 [Zestosphaera tikiterensis]|uniref:CARDB domain-containing protein n=1 Tax=Zestosphaera tikiterensis TaxID=1973259 RepID=A0A2R7Y7R7_9CREN|nr:MAG: hypothetical protein B7O98_03235 [Zestosphaera tikiterensis]
MLGKLGGPNNPKHLTSTIYVENVLSKAVLTLLVRGRDLKPRITPWKISLNDVTLSREFKPQTLLEFSDSTYALLAYEVTPIATNPGKYLLKISSETSETLEVLQASLTGVSESMNVLTAVSHYSGIVGLAPGESTAFELPDKGFSLGAYLSVKTPSKNSALVIEHGGIKSRYANLLEVDEVVIKDMTTAVDDKTLKIKHEVLNNNNVGSLSVKTLLLSDVLIYKPLSRGPQLNLDLIKASDGRIEVLVSNEGDVNAEKPQLVLLANGRLINKYVIDKLIPGEIKNLELKLSDNVNVSGLILRLIYNSVWGQTYKSVRLDDLLKKVKP